MTLRNVKLPAAVSGGDYRIPLKHPEIDIVGKALDQLYRNADLGDDRRTELLGLYKDLRQADRFILNTWGQKPLPATDLRPMLPDDASRPISHCFGEPSLLVNVGFVCRLKEYLEAYADEI